MKDELTEMEHRARAVKDDYADGVYYLHNIMQSVDDVLALVGVVRKMEVALRAAQHDLDTSEGVGCYEYTNPGEAKWTLSHPSRLLVNTTLTECGALLVGEEKP